MRQARKMVRLLDVNVVEAALPMRRMTHLLRSERGQLFNLNFNLPVSIFLFSCRYPIPRVSRSAACAAIIKLRFTLTQKTNECWNDFEHIFRAKELVYFSLLLIIMWFNNERQKETFELMRWRGRFLLFGRFSARNADADASESEKQ